MNIRKALPEDINQLVRMRWNLFLQTIKKIISFVEGAGTMPGSFFVFNMLFLPTKLSISPIVNTFKLSVFY